mmetsp:Transcript_25626/g.73718  ORF Transcript_25626/g.73718 Transcript_25626/m.73718 type:complete len:208 (-) Transcript_25626:35-658(-)
MTEICGSARKGGDDEKPSLQPVFLENPDGSLMQGVPLGYKEQTPPGTPRFSAGDVGMSMSGDVLKTLARHEIVFMSLLFAQFASECTFETIYAQYADDAIFELSLMYPALSLYILRFIYWSAAAAECLYSGSFIGLGVVAVFKGRPRLYQRFATVALAGTLGQLPLAYLNRFNLLIFLLRFISYAYARFQANLIIGLQSLFTDPLLP